MSLKEKSELLLNEKQLASIMNKFFLNISYKKFRFKERLGKLSCYFGRHSQKFIYFSTEYWQV